MIPETANNYADWLKTPDPLTGTKGEVAVGDTVEIANEFHPVASPKLKKFLYGEVKLPGGEVRALGINQTSYFKISMVFGKDTKAWVGKTIRYEGLKRFTQGTGHLWTAVGDQDEPFNEADWRGEGTEEK